VRRTLRRPYAVLGLSCTFLLLWGGSHTVSAQEARPDPTNQTITLVGQRREFTPPTTSTADATTTLGQAGTDFFVLDLLLEQRRELKGAAITATVYQRVRTRETFRQAADRNQFGSPIGFVSTKPPAIRNGGVVTTVRIPIGEPSASCPQCIKITAGIYPVSIEFRNGDEETLDRFTTFLTAANDDGGSDRAGRLQVGLIVPLQAPPSLRAAQDVAPVQSARSLISMVEALASQRQVRVSILANPQSLDQLEPTDNEGNVATNGLLDLLRLVLTDREVLSGPYVRVLPEIVDAPSFQPYRRQLFALGRTSLKERLQREPIDTIMVAPKLLNSDETLDELNISKLIVGPEALEGLPEKLPLAMPIIVDPGARSGNATAARPAVVLDESIAARFTKKLPGRGSTGDDQLRAQHVIAELSLIETLTSGRENSGLPIAVPPETTQATLVAVLNELAVSTTLSAVPVSRLFDAAPEQDDTGAPILYTPATGPSNADGRTIQQRANTIANYAAIEERNTGYASLFGAAGPDPQQAKTVAEIANLRREAATLLAADFNEKQRSAATSALRTEFDRLLDRVANQSSRRVTLTARSQEVPISLVNDTGRPITISMIVETENAELPRARRDPNAPARQILQEVITIAGRVQEQPVTVATKGPGRYSMLVRLQTPSGYEFSRTRYTLQATSIGALGKLLTTGSLLFLAFWWLKTISRKKRTRSAQRHPAHLPTEAGVDKKPTPQRTQRR
jgi:Family of unknown function (DUF6049)